MEKYLVVKMESKKVVMMESEKDVQ